MSERKQDTDDTLLKNKQHRNDTLPDFLNWEIGRKLYIAKNEVLDSADYLYRQQYLDVKRYCKEASDLINAKHREKRLRDVNTVIGIEGGRGSGKSSLLYSLKDALKDDYYVLDVIDPSDFDSHMSILESFLAYMFEAYKRNYKKYESRHGELAPLSMNTMFKNLTETLSKLRIDKALYNDENPSVEILSDMAKRISVRQNISDLCIEFLKMINSIKGEGEKDKSRIVVCVDDIDLVENEYVYLMLEDIRKFLSGNVVLILTYRYTQLFNAVSDRKHRENEVLVEQRVVSSNELQNQTQRYLSKLFPEMRVVHLYEQSVLLAKPIVDVLRALGEGIVKKRESDLVRATLVKPYDLDEDIAVKQWIDIVLYRKILIKVDPVNSLENTPYNYPNNLRELIALTELIHKMELPSIRDSKNLQNDSFGFSEKCARNLTLYKKQIISGLSESLSSRELSQVEQWDTLSPVAKNHNAYSIFLERYLTESSDMPSGGARATKPVDSKQSELLDIRFVLPENVTIADVSDIINRYIYACSQDAEKVYYGYFFKLLYSIELLSLFLKLFDISESNGNADSISNGYLDLINACIIPPSPSKATMFSAWLPARTSIADYKEEPLRDLQIPPETTLQDSVVWIYESAKKLIGAFGYTSQLTTGKIFKNARPGYGSLFEHTSYRGRSVLAQGFDDYYLPLQGSRAYPVDPLNVLAKREYINDAISRIKNSMEGAYIFYSMFDLDVFRGLTFDLKYTKKENMLKYLQRCNTMIFVSFYEDQRNDRIQGDIGNDLKTLMRIENSYDLELSKKLCTAFVRDGSYRMFDEDGIVLPLEQISAIYGVLCDMQKRDGKGKSGESYESMIESE